MIVATNILLLLTALAFCLVSYRVGWTGHYGPADVPPHLAHKYPRQRRVFRAAIVLNIGTLLLMAAHVLARGALGVGPEWTGWALGAGGVLALLAGWFVWESVRA